MLDRIRSALARSIRPPVAERTAGRPTSSNAASSFHAHWVLPAGRYTEAAVIIEVRTPPVVDRLYFFALQASFQDGAGRRHGGGHLGLQWHPRHPGGTAVNWGGYGPDGRELHGSTSELPSALANVNTRDYVWEPARRYELRIVKGEDGWDGLVGDPAALRPVRCLHAGGDRLAGLVMWSEVFADCDHPTVEVRWSGMVAVTADGTTVRPRAVALTYQSEADGGCSNTDTTVEGDEVVQRTAVPRANRGTLSLEQGAGPRG
jgi:hypothetical protein